MTTDLRNLSHDALIATRRDIGAVKLLIRQMATWRNGGMDQASAEKCRTMNVQIDAINAEIERRVNNQRRD